MCTVLLVASMTALQCAYCRANDLFSNEFNENSDGDDEHQSSSPLFRDCGGVLRGATRGIISTPNFPDVFPYPISCKWVIEAPAGKAIILYLTQFYLKDGLRATEYAYYHDDYIYAGRKELGLVSCEDDTTFLLSKKPVLVLELDIKDITNIHLRVMDHFLDVYGFNITYEILDRDDSGSIKPRQDVCSALQCSFNGNCYVNSNFEKYYCSCFSVILSNCTLKN